MGDEKEDVVKSLIGVFGLILGGSMFVSCGDPCADLEQELCDLWFLCGDEEDRLAMGMTDEEACLAIVGEDLDFLQFDKSQCSGWLDMTSADSCTWPWGPYDPTGDDDSAADDDSVSDDDSASDDDSVSDDDSASRARNSLDPPGLSPQDLG